MKIPLLLLASSSLALPSKPPFIPPFLSSTSQPQLQPIPPFLSEMSSTSQQPQVQLLPSIHLSDIIGTHRSLSSFHSLARQHDAVSTLLSSPSPPLVVLAAPNAAIDALPLKPWEDPREYAAYGAQAYDGSGGKSRADLNVRKFVEAHIVVCVPGQPWEGGQRARTVGDRTVWWEMRGGKRFIMPDDIEVDRVASRVANGELWILKGVLTRP